MEKHIESTNAIESSIASIGRNAGVFEGVNAGGTYAAQAIGPREECRDQYLKLRDELDAFIQAGNVIEQARIKSLMESMEEVKWTDTIHNLVTTVGANNLLDNHLSGSGYTAAWYIGLISSTSYTTGPAVGDTASSHAGWTEDTNYSQGSRPTAAFSAAAAKSKALSSALTYSINASVTIKGCFLISVSTKGGTTGTLYSAGLFSGGDKVLQSGDTLNVNYTATA